MSDGYELRYFTRKWNLTTAEGVGILRQHGNDRAKLNAAAMELRRRKQAPRP